MAFYPFSDWFSERCVWFAHIQIQLILQQQNNFISYPRNKAVVYFYLLNNYNYKKPTKTGFPRTKLDLKIKIFLKNMKQNIRLHCRKFPNQAFFFFFFIFCKNVMKEEKSIKTFFSFSWKGKRLGNKYGANEFTCLSPHCKSYSSYVEFLVLFIHFKKTVTYYSKNCLQILEHKLLVYLEIDCLNWQVTNKKKYSNEKMQVCSKFSSRNCFSKTNTVSWNCSFVWGNRLCWSGKILLPPHFITI